VGGGGGGGGGVYGSSPNLWRGGRRRRTLCRVSRFKANVTYYITIERWCGRNWRKYGGDGGMAYSSFIDVSALGGIGGQG
jgi:hypothetical protein